jgi:hypothetical protein
LVKSPDGKSASVVVGPLRTALTQTGDGLGEIVVDALREPRRSRLRE